MNKALNKQLGSILQRLRKDKKMTVRDVASKLKKGVSTVSDHELGKISISLEVLYEYCDLYNVDATDVLRQINYQQK